MPSKLVIVESPAKANTLSRYLGNEYLIRASMGHIRDLPSDELAVDIEHDFEPKYEVIASKKKTVAELRKAAKQIDTIFLATDPDREGEAIAWHIAHLLNGKGGAEIMRVQFNEITESAVREAVANPGKIDLKKVDAQQARRVLDRLVGYLVSQQLWKVICKGLSAGRVQSVALRLIVEREDEINAFVPEEYWNITARALLDKIDPFQVKLVKMAGKDAVVPGGEVADQVVKDLKALPAELAAVKQRTSKQKPHAPFTTSTLQQEAARRLHMGVKRTMSTAQRLYEGIELGDGGAVGLITYMRTDSTRVSQVAIKAAREYVLETYGEAFLAKKPRQYGKKGKNTQDAHEAIRPTSMQYPPEKVKKYLKKDQQRLYELIWNRFMATQMTDAVYAGATVEIGVGQKGEAPAGQENGKQGEHPYLLRAVGRVLTFPGFRKLWGEGEKEDSGPKKGEEEATELPEVFFNLKGNKQPVPEAGAPAEIRDVEGEQKFTQPPARYSESMLVKTLDELGIGRPSTYAQIISTIQDRKYVERDEKRRLAPTELGGVVNKILVSEFEEVFNVAFTAQMEEALDKVEEGGSWTETVQRFWEPFSSRIETFKEQHDEIKAKVIERTERTCPRCNEGELIVRWGRYGRFVSCDRFPKCKYMEKLGGEQQEKKEPEKTGRSCPTCEKGELLVREGRNGRFLGCSRYPKCRHTEELPGEEGKRKRPDLPEVSLSCPREGCGGEVVAKRTRRGKLFFSCTNWKAKKCPVAYWDEPVPRACPACEYPYLTIKGKNLVCPECKHKEPYEGDPPSKVAEMVEKSKKGGE